MNIHNELTKNNCRILITIKLGETELESNKKNEIYEKQNGYKFTN
ncbi:hypothetical protein VCHA53O466_40065 [Vibrio chagasii]|nr:hypothetical protein VCHA53O466_40065 [Vibrio chagasii]